VIRDYRAVREISNAIAHEADAVMEAYRRSRVTDEPHITDRLMGAIESRIRIMSFGPVFSSTTGGGFRSRIAWEAHTLRSGSRAAAHEKKYGADILGVFTANIPNYSISKGFLAQAKRAEPRIDFKSSEWNRLISQCERMLAVTPDAFVLVYSRRQGARFFSAQAVAALRGRNLFELYSMMPRAFFERHLQSFIGDKRFNAPDISVLDGLQVTLSGRHAARTAHATRESIPYYGGTRPFADLRGPSIPIQDCSTPFTEGKLLVGKCRN
jgi:hypothetical protein